MTDRRDSTLQESLQVTIAPLEEQQLPDSHSIWSQQLQSPSSYGGVADDGWKRSFVQQVKHRDKVQKENFTTVFQACKALSLFLLYIAFARQ